MALTFLQFSSEVCCDYVTLYDGYGNTSSRIELLRGSPVGISGTRFTSKQQYLFMEFKSDYSVASSGFIAFYQSVGPSNYTRDHVEGIWHSRQDWSNISNVVFFILIFTKIFSSK